MISTFQLFERFPNADSARMYLEPRPWNDGVKRSKCKAGPSRHGKKVFPAVTFASGASQRGQRASLSGRTCGSPIKRCSANNRSAV